MHTKTFTYLLLFLSTFTLSILGENGRLLGFDLHEKFKTITIDDGLSQNMVNTVIQDSRGFMWFGTKDGLNRYDGYNFKIYKKEISNPYSLGDNFITVLYEDDDENLWIGTKFGGIYIYDAYNDRFQPIETGLAAEETHLISSITGNTKDGIWVSSLNGSIFGFQVKKKSKGNVPEINLDVQFGTKELEGAIPESIFLDENNQLWIPTGTGLKRFDIHTKKLDSKLIELQSYSIDLEHPSNKILVSAPSNSPIYHRSRNIIQDHPKNILWVPSHHGLYKIDLTKNESILYKCSGGIITVLPTKDAQGDDVLIMGTHTNGVLSLNLNRLIINKQIKDKELFGDGILTKAYKSREGDIWLATNGRGILYYSPNFNLFKNPFLSIIKSHPQLSSSIYGIYSIRHQGSEYLMIQSLSYTLIQKNGEKTFYLDTNLHVKSAQVDLEDRLWLGSNIGLLQYDLISNKIQIKDSVEKIIPSLYIDKKNNIWYTTPNVLKKYNPQNGEFEEFVFYDQLKDKHHQVKETLHSIIEPDLDGKLWIGSANGLLLFDTELKKFIPFPLESLSKLHEIKSIKIDHWDPSTYLWIGSPTGLHRLNKKTGEVKTFTTNDGLPNNTVYGILTDKTGTLWMSTNKGISLYNPKNNTFVNFDVNNGLQSNEFNTGSYRKGIDGEMFFGGIKGYNRFFPENINYSTSPKLYTSQKSNY